MKVLALVLVVFVASSLAALSTSSGKLVIKPGDSTVTVSSSLCGTAAPGPFTGNYDCTSAAGSVWSFSPASANTTSAGITSNTAGVLTLDPAHLNEGLITLVFKIYDSGTPRVLAATEQLSVLVTSKTGYTSIDNDLTDNWVATLVSNNPARNRQWTPAALVTGSFTGEVPYSFTDRDPEDPANRPSPVPLYWGNFYEIRLGLVNDVTNTYCGSVGTWPAGTNDDDVAPTQSHPDWKTANSYGCPSFLEAGDTWVFPAPYQRIPDKTQTDENGYDTIANQNGNLNTLVNGTTAPLVWSVRNGTGSSLIFTGLARPAGWLASCAPADTINNLPQTWPCSAQRYNPDPQVWVVSATGGQPTRITQIGSSLTPKYQNNPAITYDLLTKTNEFQVQFVWGNFSNVDTDAATGQPGQPALAHAPYCFGTSPFVGHNASRAADVTYNPTCDQGLVNVKELLSCDDTTYPENCLPRLTAVGDNTGATFGTGTYLVKALKDNSDEGTLDGVWISQKPLQLAAQGDVAINAGNGAASSLDLTYDAQLGTQPVVVSFPLNTTTNTFIQDNYWDQGAVNGTTNSGVVFIKPSKVFACPDWNSAPTPTCRSQTLSPEDYLVGSVGDFFGGAANVPTLNISTASRVATFQFTTLPKPADGNTWLMFFDVTDNSGNAYSWNSIPYISITVADVITEFINFPPGGPSNGVFFITQPQSSAPNSYHYQLRIKRSPKSLNVAQVVINWVFPDGGSPLQFWANGTQLTSFTFTGDQTVFDFQVYTQQTPTGPFSLSFTSSSAFVDAPLTLTNLYVAANPISVKTQVGSRSEGPYVGEPVWFELTFSPPATSSFTVTAAGSGLFEQSKSVTVNVGDTGAKLGPVTPILPQNEPLSTESFTTPVSFSVSSPVYSVPGVVALPVFRHTFVITNGVHIGAADANHTSLSLYTVGERSRPFCVSTAYNVFNNSVLVGATDSVTLTFAAASEESLAGLIFEPASVSLSAANPKQCVTIRADRSYPWDSEGSGPWTYVVYTYLGGSLAAMFRNPQGLPGTDVANGTLVWGFPHVVTVSDLTVEVELDQSKLTTAANTYLVGETVQLKVWVDTLPATGLNYTIVAPGVSIAPSADASGSTSQHGRFGPAPANGAPAQFQIWDVTFTGFAGDIADASLNRTVEFTIYLSSGDAVFYRDTPPTPGSLGAVAVAHAAVLVRKRTLTLTYTEPKDSLERSGVHVKSAVPFYATATASFSLQQPVVSNLTVNIAPRSTNGAFSAGLTFDATALYFTPTSPNSQAVSISGNLLGDYEWTVWLSGPDADWFDLELPSEWLTTHVIKRLGFDFESSFLGDASSDSLFSGVTYGPVGVTFGEPLGLGESLTVTPHGSDFVFNPATVTLGPGQSQALFSFVYRGTTPVTESVVFFTVSGPSAWMYEYDAAALRQHYSFESAEFEVHFSETENVLPGTTHEGYVVLPFPVTTDLTVTPLAVGSSLTFNPSTWTFTPTTGTTLHFTYTVGAATGFSLSSNTVEGEDSTVTDGAEVNVVFLVSGTDSDSFAWSFTPVSITLRRPEFRLDATYGAKNVKEQNFSTSFIVGKWSTLYSVYLTAPPAAGAVTLTLTDSKNVLEFLVGQSPASSSAVLTFTPDNYVQHFKFRFVNLLSGDSFYHGVDSLSVSVSGTNATAYGFSNIFTGFSGLQVLPALAFSPIPAIYTDGSAKGLFVAAKDKNGAIGGAWPYADDAQFTVHVAVADPSLQGAVAIEPSTLEFSKSQSTDPVQSFTITHTYPRLFDAARSYALKFSLHFAGSNEEPVDITALVPQDAQNVLLARYQIIPKFPHVLSYGWQSASLNLSHVPVAHVSFTPRLPPVDGDTTIRGARAAGRVDFEPPVLVAAPGQQVINFKVKAQPGVDRDNLYYRVDWEVHGHKDDLVNWVEYLQKDERGLSSEHGAVYFATWHLASAGITTVSFALIAAACLVAVRNMF